MTTVLPEVAEAAIEQLRQEAADKQWAEVLAGLRGKRLAVYDDILRFGADVEVLGPPSLRQSTQRAVEQLAKLYALDSP
jgi:predicted DNA-binding transcriptional regulator YafY